MKIFVTGGTGHVGESVLRLLSESGHDCRVLTRDPEFVRGRAGNLPRISPARRDLTTHPPLSPSANPTPTAIWTRKQGNTTIKPGQYLIVDAIGHNLKVVNRISSGAFVTIYKCENNGTMTRIHF